MDFEQALAEAAQAHARDLQRLEDDPGAVLEVDTWQRLGDPETDGIACEDHD